MASPARRVPCNVASCAGRPTSRLEAGRRRPEWLLVDGLQGGSGQTVDWARLAVPAAAAARGWLLAGGLAPGNVRAALALARPAGVDVASGVAGADGLRKDLALVAAFVAAVRGPAP